MDAVRPFGFGTGSFESGPAKFDNTSKLDRRLAFKSGVLPFVTADGKDEGGGDEFMGSNSSDKKGGELRIPGGNGRGPRKMVFSRLCSCACWCLIVCFKVDICVRMATKTRGRQ